jgi:hypothetical protein
MGGVAEKQHRSVAEGGARRQAPHTVARDDCDARLARSARHYNAKSDANRGTTSMSTMTRSGLALLLVAALAACGPDVSQANYDKITDGMKEEQVGKILGTASESRNTTVRVQGENFTSTVSKWRNDKGTIVVEFAGGEVQRKIYYPPGAEPAPERRY